MSLVLCSDKSRELCAPKWNDLVLFFFINKVFLLFQKEGSRTMFPKAYSSDEAQKMLLENQQAQYGDASQHLGSPREDQELKASLSYTASSRPANPRNTNWGKRVGGSLAS